MDLDRQNYYEQKLLLVIFKSVRYIILANSNNRLICSSFNNVRANYVWFRKTISYVVMSKENIFIRIILDTTSHPHTNIIKITNHNFYKYINYNIYF